MDRRLFLRGGSAFSLATALAACGGGGGAPGVTTGVTLDPQPGAPGTPGTGNPSQPPSQGPRAPGELGYAFGARHDLVGGRYPHGIMPRVSASEMDAVIKSCYDRWKASQLRSFPDFRDHYGNLVTGARYIRFDNNYATVSEAVSYGMLIFVVMAGHDPEAKACFDGLFKTVRARPAYGHGDRGRYLFDWRLHFDGSSAGGGWNAHDGDEDIAQALLMAHRQWGSDGEINYLQEAVNTINAMRSVNWAASGEPRYGQRHSSRISDYMTGHFRSYRKYSGDAFWDLSRERCLQLVQHTVNNFSPVARLVPDFIVDTNTGWPTVSPGYVVDPGPWERWYGPNSCRVPWRWGTDFVYSGDQAWGELASGITRWIKNDCGGDPNNVCPDYNLDGSPVNGHRYFAEGIVGPLLCGAMTSPEHQDFLDALWTNNARQFTTDYYDSELQLIPMIVASGNWWNP